MLVSSTQAASFATSARKKCSKNSEMLTAGICERINWNRELNGQGFCVLNGTVKKFPRNCDMIHDMAVERDLVLARKT